MAHNSGDLPHEDPVGSKKWFWPDGTPVTPAESKELISEEEGNAPTPGSGVNTSVQGQTDLSGATDNENAGPPEDLPGGSLDTTNADEERQRIEGLLAQLQQQAATGDGAWEDTLHQSVLNAQSAASSLGQAQANTGGGYQSALRNIGNAQSAAAQRSVGEGNILRAESQQHAQSQIGDMLGLEGSQDVGQAASDAAAHQGVHEANAALNAEGQKATLGYIQGGAQAAGTLASLSDGGRVPGKPKVFGDDSRNDTVPAMLSPYEIVVPISAAKDPDKAAAFARAVAMRGGAQGLADGGKTAWQPGDPDPSDRGFSWTGMSTNAPSVENGGVLDGSRPESNRTATLSLADALQQRGTGGGPSVVPQMLTNSSDDTIAGAMQTQQQARESNNAALLSAASAQQQHAGADAAGAKLKETDAANKQQGDLLGALRSRDLALAQAQQQAEWRNTSLNSGISLQNQQMIQGLIGAAGQTAVGLAGALGKHSSGDPTKDVGPDSGGDTAGDRAGMDGVGGGDQTPPNEGTGGGDTVGDRAGMAHGGLVFDDADDEERSRVRSFLQILRRAA